MDKNQTAYYNNTIYNLKLRNLNETLNETRIEKYQMIYKYKGGK